MSKNNILFDVGFFIILFLGLLLGIATLFLILGSTIEGYILPMSFILTSIILFCLNKKKYSIQECLKSITLVTLIAFGITIICAAFATGVYDLSYDGNTYHKTTIGMLKNGWNPVYQSFYDAASRSQIIPQFNWPVWYDHYPKGSWIMGATFYAFSGNIETGKCITILSIVSLGLILGGLLHKLFKTNSIKILIFLCVVLLNPITIPQIQSYYNDALMGCLIFLVLTSYITIYTDKVERQTNIKLWIIAFICINISLNIKFSGIIFMAIYSLVFFVLYLAKFKNSNFKNIAKNTTLFFVIAVISSLMFIGSTSYVRNTIQHKNPVYTMVGVDKIDIITSMLPTSFSEKSNIEQFCYSLFAESSNIGFTSIEQPRLKIPFTFTKSELLTGELFDARIGAWGSFFSGIILVSILVCIFALIKMFREKNKYLLLAITILGVTMIQPVIIPGMAMGRYFMHLFIIPIFAVGWLLFDTFSVKKFLLSILITFLCLLNISNYVYFDISRVIVSQQMRMDIQKLKNISIKNNLVITLPGGQDKQGFIFNIMDENITNFVVVPDLADGITTFNWRLAYKVEETNN